MTHLNIHDNFHNSLEMFFQRELDKGHIDFHVRAERVQYKGHETVKFYIHPQDADGETRDYYVHEGWVEAIHNVIK